MNRCDVEVGEMEELITLDVLNHYLYKVLETLIQIITSSSWSCLLQSFNSSSATLLIKPLKVGHGHVFIPLDSLLHRGMLIFPRCGSWWWVEVGSLLYTVWKKISLQHMLTTFQNSNFCAHNTFHTFTWFLCIFLDFSSPTSHVMWPMQR